MAATAYHGLARRAILGLKFRQGRYLAPLLGGLLAEAVRRRPLASDLLVPVPLAPRRERERGYNQAVLLATELLRLQPLGGATLAPELLRRSRDTPPQVRLRAAARRRNVEGAFACPRPEALRGRRVLLLDDVATTGATLEACAAVLKAAGAGRVMALVVAKDV